MKTKADEIRALSLEAGRENMRERSAPPSPPRARPTEAQVELAHCRSSWSPEEVAQALADEHARGVRAGVDLVLAEVDDWYQHPAGMLLERIRALKSTP